MTRPPLAPEEHALWARVIAGVRPLRPAPSRAVSHAPRPAPPPVSAPADPPPPKRPAGRVPAPRAIPAGPRAAPGATLDGGWDRRLRKGAHPPDRVIDLHGHTLGEAHAALEGALADAMATGERVLLVVAGRERGEGPRGGIRRALGDWLAASRHAARIAAVRPAHARHGGAGAVYLILRRPGSRAPRG